MTTSRQFIIDVSVEDGAPDAFEAADELFNAIASAALPSWLFSVDGVDPGPDHAPDFGSDS